MLYKVSLEEKLVFKILFDTNSICEKDFEIVCYKKLIKICSSQLIIPTLYSILKKNKLNSFIPSDFHDYIKWIYEKNKERNNELIKEINFISNVLNKNNIKHAFFKGASNLINKFYFNPGLRMIGDIDVLISENDKLKVESILVKEGYNNQYNYLKWKTNVLKHFKSNNKIFALDVHTAISKNKYIGFETNDLLKRSNKVNNISVLNIEDSKTIHIINFQISDYGYLKSFYNYRVLYDIYGIKNNIKPKLLNEKIIKKFDEIFQHLKLSCQDKNTFRINLLRSVIKKNYYFFSRFDNYICDYIIFIKDFPNKLLEFSFNKQYRNHVLSKTKSAFINFFNKF